jgi:hypothetical protein
MEKANFLNVTSGELYQPLFVPIVMLDRWALQEKKVRH